MGKIFEIDLVMPPSDFLSEMNSEVNNYGDGCIKIKDTLMNSRQGKNIMKYEISHGTNLMTILFELDPASGDLILRPTKFTNFQNSFYSCHLDNDVAFSDDEDVEYFTIAALYHIAKQHSGTFYALHSSGDAIGTENGMDVQPKLCVVGYNDVVYGAKDAKVGAFSSVDISFRYQFKEWISEKKVDDPQFALLLSQCTTLTQQMDIVGKYLISKKNNDEIEAEEFSDIFRQAGVLGFSDNMLLSIYKLFI